MHNTTVESLICLSHISQWHLSIGTGHTPGWRMHTVVRHQLVCSQQQSNSRQNTTAENNNA